MRPTLLCGVNLTKAAQRPDSCPDHLFVIFFNLLQSQFLALLLEALQNDAAVPVPHDSARGTFADVNPGGRPPRDAFLNSVNFGFCYVMVLLYVWVLRSRHENSRLERGTLDRRRPKGGEHPISIR